jgi:hypothetical protein
MFGRLVRDNGEPLAGAAITGSGGIGETDDNGYFQIETTDGSDLEASLPDGRKCSAELPSLKDGKEYVPVGTLICRSTISRLQLSSADLP